MIDTSTINIPRTNVFGDNIIDTRSNKDYVLAEDVEPFIKLAKLVKGGTEAGDVIGDLLNEIEEGK